MKNLFMAMVLLAALMLPSTGFSQTPSIVNNTPAESFLAEQFCFDANFSNSGTPGFGPYFLVVLDPGLTFDSATVFGNSAQVEAVGTFPAPPGNQLTDPISGNPVTGPENGTMTIVVLPVGSMIDGAPDLVTEVCLTIEPAAVVGVPLDVTLIPAYQFGDRPTGVNGPIIGTPDTQAVTPTVIEFSKTNTAPEAERPPTSSWPFDYVLAANIANTATVDNLLFNDVLPATVQFVGPITINGGNGCVATSTPSTISPGGTVTWPVPVPLVRQPPKTWW